MITLVNAATEPTERSISPERMMKVRPRAAMPRTALSVKKFARTGREKNPANFSPAVMYRIRQTAIVISSGSTVLLGRSFIFSKEDPCSQSAELLGLHEADEQDDDRFDDEG